MLWIFCALLYHVDLRLSNQFFEDRLDCWGYDQLCGLSFGSIKGGILEGIWLQGVLEARSKLFKQCCNKKGASMRVMLVQLNRRRGKLKTSHPHMGIASLAACSINRGHTTSAIDAMFEGLDNEIVFQRVGLFAPDVLGLTAKTPDIFECQGFAERMKSICPNIQIVIGGSHITALKKKVLEGCNFFDYGVFGEGENTFTELLDSILERDGDFSKISGLIYRDTGGIKENCERSFIENLDSLPHPAWHLFPGGKDIPLFTSRGCPYKCIFCQRVMGSSVRVMSPERVIDDMQRSIKERGTRFFQIEDETFGVDKKWTHQVLDLIIRKEINRKISWAANSRVNLADHDLYKKMKTAGCSILGFGIESGNQEILDAVSKGFKLLDAVHAIDAARKADIRTNAFFIFGHPNETPATVRDTINFACKLNPKTVSFGMMIPYPGTKIFQLAKANQGGYRNLSEDWSKYTKYFGGAMEFVNFKKGQLARYQRQAYIEFYLRNFRFFDLLPVIKKYLSVRS